MHVLSSDEKPDDCYTRTKGTQKKTSFEEGKFRENIPRPQNTQELT